MQELRLASANLCSGRRVDGTVATGAELAAALHDLRPDVLALQEVDVAQSRSHHVDQAAASGLAHYRFVRTVAGTPGARRDEGEYGIALATDLPVREWHVFRLGRAPGRYPLLVPARPPRLMLLPDEPRAVVAAVLEMGITVACTHLSFVPGVNAYQLSRVVSWLRTLPGPRVLLGDLNLPPGPVRRVARAWTPLVSGSSFPSPAPRVQLDHALGHDLPAGADKAELIRMPLSDHLAVRVELTIP